MQLQPMQLLRNLTRTTRRTLRQLRRPRAMQLSHFSANTSHSSRRSNSSGGIAISGRRSRSCCNGRGDGRLLQMLIEKSGERELRRSGCQRCAEHGRVVAVVAILFAVERVFESQCLEAGYWTAAVSIATGAAAVDDVRPVEQLLHRARKLRQELLQKRTVRVQGTPAFHTPCEADLGHATGMHSAHTGTSSSEMPELSW